MEREKSELKHLAKEVSKEKELIDDNSFLENLSIKLADKVLQKLSGQIGKIITQINTFEDKVNILQGEIYE